MKIEGKKIEFFPSLYEEWKERQKSLYDKLNQHMEQYKGSKKIDSVSGQAEDATVVRNITYELTEAQVDTRRPAPIITPKNPIESHLRYARNAVEYLKLQMDEQPFEEMNDIDERRTYIYGGSGWMVEWDNTYKTHNEIGRPEVKCVNPMDIIGQPGVYNIQDMDACFVKYNTTREDVMAKYGVTMEVAEKTEGDTETDTEDDTVTVVVCWYHDDDGNICKYVFSDDIELEDISDYWSRKREVCDSCGRDRELSEDENGNCSCGGRFILQNDEYEELTHDITTSDGRIIPAMSPVYENGRAKTETVKQPVVDDMGNPVFEYDENGLPIMAMMDTEQVVMEPTRIKWFKPNMIPIVIRKNTSQEDSLLGQSDCEYIRPQQQEINKLESRLMRKLKGSSVSAVLPQDSIVQADDGVFDHVIRLQPGENKGLYGVIDTTPDISADVMQSDRLYDHAQRLLGITDSFMGQADTTAKSGIAKQVQVQQSAGRLASKKVMKAAAYQELFEIMFQMPVAYADEPRSVSIQDQFGFAKGGQFNRYDFLEQDEYTGEWYYDLGYTFSADLSGGVEMQSEQRWQQIATDYQAGLYGDPARTDTRLRMWMDREEAGYPGAHKNVEYERKMLQQEMQAAEQAQQIAQQMPMQPVA